MSTVLGATTARSALPIDNSTVGGAQRRSGFGETVRKVLDAMREGLDANQRYHKLRARGLSPHRAAAAALEEFSPPRR